MQNHILSYDNVDLSHIEAAHWYILDILVSGRPEHSNVGSGYYRIPSHLPVICSLMSITEKNLKTIRCIYTSIYPSSSSCIHRYNV